MALNSANRSVLLANGTSVPLASASRWYGEIRCLLEDPDQEWGLVYFLREVCLGRAIDREPAQALILERLVRPDGGVDPVLKAVVLSAVRGEGRVLHVSSPFTDPVDRAMAEFLEAREYIRASLPENEAEEFIASDPAQWAADVLRGDGRGELSADDKNQLVKDVLRRLGNVNERKGNDPAPDTPPGGTSR